MASGRQRIYFQNLEFCSICSSSPQGATKPLDNQFCFAKYAPQLGVWPESLFSC